MNKLTFDDVMAGLYQIDSEIIYLSRCSTPDAMNFLRDYRYRENPISPASIISQIDIFLGIVKNPLFFVKKILYKIKALKKRTEPSFSEMGIWENVFQSISKDGLRKYYETAGIEMKDEVSDSMAEEYIEKFLFYLICINLDLKEISAYLEKNYLKRTGKENKSDNEDVNGLNEDDTREIKKIIKSRYETIFITKLEKWRNKCIEDKFNRKQYTILYILIREEYKEWFLDRSFAQIQEALDPFFGKKTTSYKEFGVKNQIESAKISFPWLRSL